MLKHDYARKKRSGFNRKKKIIIFLIIAIALLFFSIFIYEKGRPHPEVLNTAYAQHWWQRHVAPSTVSPTITTNKMPTDTEIPIHFEFYSSLPTMQNPVIALPQKIAASSFAETQNVKLVAHPLKNRIVSPDDLATAISHPEAAYLLQLGVFKYANSAENYRQSLNKKALDAVIVKINFAKNTRYRVQLGPFAKKEQANLLQKQLQKKGIHSVLYTVTTS